MVLDALLLWLRLRFQRLRRASRVIVVLRELVVLLERRVFRFLFLRLRLVLRSSYDHLYLNRYDHIQRREDEMLLQRLLARYLSGIASQRLRLSSILVHDLVYFSFLA